MSIQKLDELKVSKSVWNKRMIIIKLSK